MSCVSFCSFFLLMLAALPHAESKWKKKVYQPNLGGKSPANSPKVSFFLALSHTKPDWAHMDALPWYLSSAGRISKGRLRMYSAHIQSELARHKRVSAMQGTDGQFSPFFLWWSLGRSRLTIWRYLGRRKGILTRHIVRPRRKGIEKHVEKIWEWEMIYIFPDEAHKKSHRG